MCVCACGCGCVCVCVCVCVGVCVCGCVCVCVGAAAVSMDLPKLIQVCVVAMPFRVVCFSVCHLLLMGFKIHSPKLPGMPSVLACSIPS